MMYSMGSSEDHSRFGKEKRKAEKAKREADRKAKNTFDKLKSKRKKKK